MVLNKTRMEKRGGEGMFKLYRDPMKANLLHLTYVGKEEEKVKEEEEAKR